MELLAEDGFLCSCYCIFVVDSFLRGCEMFVVVVSGFISGKWGFELLLVDCWRNVCIGDGGISGGWALKQLLVIVMVGYAFISGEWVFCSCWCKRWVIISVKGFL